MNYYKKKVLVCYYNIDLPLVTKSVSKWLVSFGYFLLDCQHFEIQLLWLNRFCKSHYPTVQKVFNKTAVWYLLKSLLASLLRSCHLLKKIIFQFLNSDMFKIGMKKILKRCQPTVYSVVCFNIFVCSGYLQSWSFSNWKWIKPLKW
jgi:hypothetical protein